MENSTQVQSTKRKNKMAKQEKIQKTEDIALLAKEKEAASHLESILFGNLRDPSSLEFGHELEKKDDLRSILTRDQESGQALSEEKESVVRKPAWVDDEEEETQVNLAHVNRLRKLLKVGEDGVVSGKEYVNRLRAFHEKLNPNCAWAQLPSEKLKKKRQRHLDDMLDSDSDLDGSVVDNDEDIMDSYNVLQTTDELVVKSKTKLPQGILSISQLRDANAEEPSRAVVESVQFHRNAQILMTAGQDKSLRFFQIDGKRNPKVQSIFLENYPIQKAAFVPDGSKVVASGRRKYYYVYDMNSGSVQRMEPLFGREEKSLESFEVSPDSNTVAFIGNEGYILLASLKVKQLIGTLKMNGTARSVAFSDDGRRLLSLGGDGEVYYWDIGTRRCIHKGVDEGCIKGTCITASPDSSIFATGSNTGVVNLYEKERFINGEHRPVKTLMNLVTSAHSLKFNPDSQILAMTSKMKKNALKLVHLPSYTVFSNWPTTKTPLQYVHSLDFSPGGGYLAVGNAAGKVLLYRLQHYERA